MENHRMKNAIPFEDGYGGEGVDVPAHVERIMEAQGATKLLEKKEDDGFKESYWRTNDGRAHILIIEGQKWAIYKTEPIKSDRLGNAVLEAMGVVLRNVDSSRFRKRMATTDSCQNCR
jgi:hypothetical protein